jgi:uncharacterized membrane protein
MSVLVAVLVIFIALEHLGFLYLEMFLWTKQQGRKVFANTIEQTENTQVRTSLYFFIIQIGWKAIYTLILSLILCY